MILVFQAHWNCEQHYGWRKERSPFSPSRLNYSCGALKKHRGIKTLGLIMSSEHYINTNIYLGVYS